MPKNQFIKILLILVGFLIIGVASYGSWGINKDIKRITEETSEIVIQPKTESEIFSPNKKDIEPQETDSTELINTYSNSTIGISFQYPKEYCVGSFTKEELGLKHDSPVEYLIMVDEIEDDTNPCSTPFRPGPPSIFDIAVFSNPGQKPVEDWVKSYFKIFMLPSMAIDGIQALRFFTGEGAPEKGMPFYNILFEKDDFVFILSTEVDCTASDGSCEPPRDYKFIDHIDSMARTIRFIH